MPAIPIYTLISRGQETILAHHTPFAGNFQPLTLDILKNRNPKKKFYQQGSLSYRFYSYFYEGFYFVVLVEKKYNIKRAFNFLKDIQEKFFAEFVEEVRNAALAYKLTAFNKTISSTMKQYSEQNLIDPEKISQSKLTSEEEKEVSRLTSISQIKEQIYVHEIKSRFSISEDIPLAQPTEDEENDGGCNCKCQIM